MIVTYNKQYTEQEFENFTLYQNLSFKSTNVFWEYYNLIKNNSSLTADECVNSPYAELFAEELVEKDEFGGYLDYELDGHNYDSAVDSVQTLFRTLGVKPTDYILRDEQ